jgi:hypothetical protein
VSNSPSPELESDRLPASAAGTREEERGGGKVASLIVEDIHNIPVGIMRYFCKEEYLQRPGVIFLGCSPN